MNPLKALPLLLLAALAAAPAVYAQTTDNSTSDPTVNSTDFDDSTPPADTSYMNDTSSGTNGTSDTTTDPTVSASDFDNSTPPADDSYLNDSSSTTDPTVSNSDFDTSAPTTDTSYLGDGQTAGTPTPSGSGAAAGAKGTPGFEVVLLAGALVVASVAARRK